MGRRSYRFVLGGYFCSFFYKERRPWEEALDARHVARRTDGRTNAAQASPILLLAPFPPLKRKPFPKKTKIKPCPSKYADYFWAVLAVGRPTAGPKIGL
jgi:hypothetical protein